MAVYILLDVGGTGIKGGVFDENGSILGSMEEFPARAREDQETILRHFVSVIRELWKKYPAEKIAGIGMAFPGPFDYERGISLMKELDKYDSIYGLELEKEIKRRDAGLSGVPVIFLHDVEAFAIGACTFGKASLCRRVICLCIGTGAGSAFVEDGVPQKAKTDRVPENGWIYNTPFRASIIDDYLSVRGLKKVSRDILKEELDGRALSLRCQEGDVDARNVYTAFGEILDQCMSPFLHSFCPDALVLGGQITKSFIYFGQKLEKTCHQSDIQIIMEENTSLCAMQGLYITIRRRQED